MKQIICDKCKKPLVIFKVRNKNDGKLDEEWGWIASVFKEFPIVPEWREEIEGSKIIVNLPKYKIINKTYDLCENCTKEFLKTNIQK